MFPMVTGFMNYGQQTIRAARYIGQSFIITLSHTNRYLSRFNILMKNQSCQSVFEVESTLNLINVLLVKDIQKKQLLNYSIDFGVCIFCGNCVEYCPTNCLSMTEEYELSTYDRHELNYNQIALGRLPISIIGDYTIQTVRNSTPIQIDKENSFDSRTITNY
ncbi:hypothetical protein LUZ62_000546 [Rhynchospora pubera]|uniref:4Fe-4S ferredoxin-type domain-containing protein n=1 Tax=Rhynchospora pubera TaxID=906938 RepID=A0AAV8BGS8_9POAL|nr:hypothetical protein LUZ62_000546 [Rhynchospora pubera]